VSKYDLDRKSINWKQYQKERERHLTRNVECRKENEEVTKERDVKDKFESK
jgi:hypothetical protein